MIMRGGGATGADGREGAAGICVTLLGRLAALEAWLEMPVAAAVVTDGGVARGVMATGGAALVGAVGGGVFGGITTTDGGR
jgi:hypothetical protein